MTQPCYPSVVVITAASVLHRKQLLFSRQPVRLACLWVKIPSILTHTNHDSQSLPENWLFCLQCVSPDFSGFLSTAPHLPKAQSPWLFQWHYLPPFEWRVLCHRGQRDRENPALWGGTVLPTPLLPCCNVRSLSVCAQTGRAPAGPEITAWKCTSRTALGIQRLFFCSMLCTLPTASATLQALSGEGKNCHSSHPHSPPKKRALKNFRSWEKKNFSSLTWILEVAQAAYLAWRISCQNIFKFGKITNKEIWGLTAGKIVQHK